MPGARRIAIPVRSTSTGSATEIGNFPRSFVQIIQEIIWRTLNVRHLDPRRRRGTSQSKRRTRKLKRRDQSACVRSFTSFRMTVPVELFPIFWRIDVDYAFGKLKLRYMF